MNDIQSSFASRRLCLIVLWTALILAAAQDARSAEPTSEPAAPAIKPTLYFQCTIKRDRVLDREFTREYTFPVSPSSPSPYGFKGSMRWSSYEVKFDGEGAMTVQVDELIGGKRVKAVEKRRIGSIPQETISNVVVELVSGDIVVPYRIDCGPERRK